MEHSIKCTWNIVWVYVYLSYCSLKGRIHYAGADHDVCVASSLLLFCIQFLEEGTSNKNLKQMFDFGKPVIFKQAHVFWMGFSLPRITVNHAGMFYLLALPLQVDQFQRIDGFSFTADWCRWCYGILGSFKSLPSYHPVPVCCCASKSAALTKSFSARIVNIPWLISGSQSRSSTHHSVSCFWVYLMGFVFVWMQQNPPECVCGCVCMCCFRVFVLCMSVRLGASVPLLAFLRCIYEHLRVKVSTHIPDVIWSDTNKSKSH